MRRIQAVAVLLAVLMATALAALSPLRAEATSLPNSRAGLGVQWYYGTQAEYDSASAQVASSGVAWVRVDLQWDIVQAGGSSSWNWSDTDKMVAAALGRGLKVMLVTGYSPPWANGNHTDHRYFPTDVNAWSAFVTAAAQRYLPQGVTTFELWNEPNNSPQSDPALYTSNILVPGSNALRSVSRGLHVPVTVVSGGAASILDTPGITDQYAWGEGVYAAGGKSYFDAYGVHPYTWPGDPTVPGYYNSLQRVAEIHTTMANYGDGAKQVWATEFGFPTQGPNSVTEAQQADYLQKGFQVWTQSGWTWTGPMFMYVHKDGADNPNDVEANFGLVHLDGSPKPAFSMLPGFLPSVPAAPAPPTSGSAGLISGLENVNEWAGEAARTADTANRTEGNQSILATFTVPASGFANFYLDLPSPYVNLSAASSLSVDVRPTSQTPSGQAEPLVLKLEDASGGVIHEQQLPRLTANTWTTVTVDLTSIPSASRSALRNVDLYVWSGSTAALGGRTQVGYSVDDLRYQ